MPRLKGISFETVIIKRYSRRENSVEEALIEIYLAGISVRRVEDIAEVFWGTKALPSTISELNKKAGEQGRLITEYISLRQGRPITEKTLLIFN